VAYIFFPSYARFPPPMGRFPFRGEGGSPWGEVLAGCLAALGGRPQFFCLWLRFCFRFFPNKPGFPVGFFVVKVFLRTKFTAFLPPHNKAPCLLFLFFFQRDIWFVRALGAPAGGGRAAGKKNREQTGLWAFFFPRPACGVFPPPFAFSGGFYSLISRLCFLGPGGWGNRARLVSASPLGQGGGAPKGGPGGGVVGLVPVFFPKGGGVGGGPCAILFFSGGDMTGLGCFFWGGSEPGRFEQQ